MALIFWLIFFIIVLCLFLVNWENIRNNIQKTRVQERLFNRPVAEEEGPQPETAPETLSPPAGAEGVGPAEGPPAEPAPASPPGPVVPPAAGVPETDGAGQTPEPVPPQETPALPMAGPAAGPPTALPTAEPTTGQTTRPTAEPTSGPMAPAGQSPGAEPSAARTVPEDAHRDRSLYFMQVDRDGTIMRTRVTRTLAVSDSPMLDVLQALLQGPSAEEQRQGLISLIPPGTRILSRTTTVRGNTAYINFSEDFMFNTYGVEGYAAQLRQIVWTVTEFSNVKDVQILVEGRRVDYLGEGIWIGSPIGRDTL